MMRKLMLCLVAGVAVGCAEPPAGGNAATEPGSSQTMGNVAALVKFSCPSMH